MFFENQLHAFLDYLERRLLQINEDLKSLPKGNMIEKRSRGKQYYYLKKKEKLHSITDNQSLVTKHLRKKLLLDEKKRIENNLHWTKKLANHYMLLSNPDTQWLSLQAEDNTYRIDEKRHLYNGIYYRSKSEAMIAAMLTSYGIEFKYEVNLNLHGFNIYPDFYIKRPKDGKIYIWEHFGLIADETYLNKTFNKLNTYHRNGYNLWDNLIVSFDQEDGSLNVDTIDKIICLFLL